MRWDILIALFNNAILLLALSVVYEATYLFAVKYRRLQKVFSGLLISIICITIMSVPFTLQSGLIFDTRTILISVTALIFGPIPTIITVAVASIFRISVGGVGVFTGLATILSSALIGLTWRRLLYPKSKKLYGLNIYAMGISVSFIMLVFILLLPFPESLNVIGEIIIPVMLIYPIVTVVLSLLLLHQKKISAYQVKLKQSEERFHDLFDKAPLGYQSLDIDGNFIDVNQQWLDTFGYSREEVIGKWFGDFVSPEYKESIRERFIMFKKQGYIHSEFKMQNKNGNSIFISFEGKIGVDSNGEFKQTHSVLKDITKQKLAEESLRLSEEMYRKITENISDIVWTTDINLKTTYVSSSVENIMGEKPEAYLKNKLEEKFSEETLKKIRAILFDEIEMEKNPEIGKDRTRILELEQYKPDGSLIWVSMSISILRDELGKMEGFLGVSRDITQRKKAEINLLESERSKSVLLSNLPGMAYRCKYDSKWTMQFVSHGCFNLTGHKPESLLNNRDLSFNDLIVPEYRNFLLGKWGHTLAKKEPFKYEYEIITATGVRKWVLEMGQGIYDSQGEVVSLEGIVLDISDRKKFENNLRYLNEHDKRTGLYNRDYFEILLKNDANKKDGSKRALIGINLSTIQILSTNYGFRYTQELIKKASAALSKFTTEECLLFQTNENHFLFYFKNYKDKNELINFSKNIEKSLEFVFVMDKISGGIGILEIENDNIVNVDFLLRNLLIASEKAINIFEKDFRTCIYDEALEEIVNRELEIRNTLSIIAASDINDEFFLQYQPIMHLKTNSICGFEALARIRTKKLGLVSPLEFIPLAEETKQIIPIGEKVFRKAFSFLNKLKAQGYEEINVSVNVSAIQLFRVDFTNRLFEIINEMDVNPKNIAIEITESVFTSDYENINNIVSKLREEGISVYIDDFGTGYSSLSRVKELGVDCLKIDKSFIDNLLDKDPDKSITSDIISMSHRVGSLTIAEGVEEENQLEYLRDNDCDKIQGYLISKPLDEELALEFLKNNNTNK